MAFEFSIVQMYHNGFTESLIDIGLFLVFHYDKQLLQ